MAKALRVLYWRSYGRVCIWSIWNLRQGIKCSRTLERGSCLRIRTTIVMGRTQRLPRDSCGVLLAKPLPTLSGAPSYSTIKISLSRQYVLWQLFIRKEPLFPSAQDITQVVIQSWWFCERSAARLRGMLHDWQCKLVWQVQGVISLSLEYTYICICKESYNQQCWLRSNVCSIHN